MSSSLHFKSKSEEEYKKEIKELNEEVKSYLRKIMKLTDEFELKE
jgi:hypothetical protein